jgi:hypothetical protein
MGYLRSIGKPGGHLDGIKISRIVFDGQLLVVVKIRYLQCITTKTLPKELMSPGITYMAY